jgi:hypothetical protein
MLACASPDVNAPVGVGPTPAPLSTASATIHPAADSTLMLALARARDLVADPLLANLVAALSEPRRQSIAAALKDVESEVARRDDGSARKGLAQLQRQLLDDARPADAPLLAAIELYRHAIDRVLSPRHDGT